MADNHTANGSLALESNIVELRLRVHMITEALDSFLGLNGYIGRHRSDIAHRDIDTIWGSAGFFGLEDERLRCILGHLPFAVDFTGYDDKLHIGVNILAKAAGIEESGIENIGVIFSGFLAKSAYIGGRSTACKVDYIVIVRLGKADVLVLGHAFGLHDMISERSSLDTFERNHVGISDMRVDRLGYEFAVKERVEVACGGIELVLGVTSKVFDFDLDLFSTFEHGYDTIFEESLCIGNRFRCRQYGVSIVGCAVRSNCK